MNRVKYKMYSRAIEPRKCTWNIYVKYALENLGFNEQELNYKKLQCSKDFLLHANPLTDLAVLLKATL